jgi:hypothetical protein
MGGEATIRAGWHTWCAPLVAVAVVLGGIVAWPDPAAGYPQIHQIHCVTRREVPWRFSGSGWTSTRTAPAAAGLDIWDGVPNSVGSPYTVTYQDATFGLPVVIEDRGPGESGEAVCSTSGTLSRIELDIAGTTDAAIIRGLAGHEMGHAHGLSHTGDGDSFDLLRPTMSTCVVPFESKGYVRQDDAAALAEDNGSTFHANASFEAGTAYWGAIGSSLTSRDGGGSDGHLYAAVNRTETGGYVYQTVRVTGTVTHSLYAREVTYDRDTTCRENTYVSDLDLNDPHLTDVNFVYRVGRTVGVTSSWQQDDSPISYTIDGYEGVDVRMRIVESVTGVYAYVDNARAYKS